MDDPNQQTVELFSGPKSFSNVAEALGFKTFTVDANPTFKPTLVADVRNLSASNLPAHPLVVWASPPDAPAFAKKDSWETDGSFAPKDSVAAEAIELFGKAVSLIAMMKPVWWFVENPKSLLRVMPATAGFNRGYPSRIRHTIRHDQYGGNGAAETDIWTNAHWWTPRPAESSSNRALPRSRRVPPMVFAEIFAQLEQYKLQLGQSGSEKLPPFGLMH